MLMPCQLILLYRYAAAADIITLIAIDTFIDILLMLAIHIIIYATCRDH